MIVSISQVIRNKCKALRIALSTQQAVITAILQTGGLTSSPGPVKPQLSVQREFRVKSLLLKSHSSVSLLSKLLQGTGDVAGSKT